MRLIMFLLVTLLVTSACSSHEGYRYIGDAIPDQLNTNSDNGDQ